MAKCLKRNWHVEILHHCTCTKKTFFWKTMSEHFLSYGWGLSSSSYSRSSHGGEHKANRRNSLHLWDRGFYTSLNPCTCVTLSSSWCFWAVWMSLQFPEICRLLPEGSKAYSSWVRNVLFTLMHLLLHSSYFNRDYYFTHRCPPKCDTVCPAFRWERAQRALS